MEFNIFSWLHDMEDECGDADEFINFVLWHGACLKKIMAENFDFEFDFEKDLENERFIAIHDKFCSVIAETKSYFNAVYAMMDERSAHFALDFYKKYEQGIEAFMQLDPVKELV